MIKSIKQKSKKIEIDLTGPDGNAYVLLGYAKNFCKQLGLDYSEIRKDMTLGDYEHLLVVFERHFGDFVTMYR